MASHYHICAEADVKGLPKLRLFEMFNAITVVPIVAPALTRLEFEYQGDELSGVQAICSDSMKGLQNLVDLELKLKIKLAAVRPLE